MATRSAKGAAKNDEASSSRPEINVAAIATITYNPSVARE